MQRFKKENATLERQRGKNLQLTRLQEYRVFHITRFSYYRVTKEGQFPIQFEKEGKRMFNFQKKGICPFCLNRVQQCQAVKQHMQNCEHDFAEQCRVVLAFSNLTCQMLVLRAVSVATVESFIPIFPYKLFRESLQVQNVVTFSQHQCKIT